MRQAILKTITRFTGIEVAHAHCDIPCGIYDPHQAQIGALTVIRMQDLIAELREMAKKEDNHHDTEHDIIRTIKVKEEHADMCKKEVATIWGDYFKPEMIEQYPDLHKHVHGIMQAASKARQSSDRATGEKLLELVNEFAETFWKCKGKETKRAKAPYKPESELVYPVL
jgi:nickel superoxide dismutase